VLLELSAAGVVGVVFSSVGLVAAGMLGDASVAIAAVLDLLLFVLKEAIEINVFLSIS